MLKAFKVVLPIAIVIMCFLGVFLVESIDVLMRFFPLDNLEAVVFTLTHNVGGSNEVLRILLEPCLKTSVGRTCLFFLLSVFFSTIYSFLLIKPKKKNLYNLLKKSIRPIIICNILFCLLVWALAIYKIPVMSYIKFYGSLLNEKPVYNSLYEKEYVYPDSVGITFEKKRNLIFIMLESIESNFQDEKNGGNLENNFIPEITDLTKKNVSFIPGGITVEGTGWTMGETVAKSCGIPLQEPIKKNEYGIRNYLRNVVCLTDVLYKNGYEIKLVQGSNALFASMNYFSVSHGIAEENILDLRYFKKKGVPISDTSFFESVKDADLYSEARNIASELGGQGKPWMLWIYTIDTHAAYGRIDSTCVKLPPSIERKKQYPFVLQCASKLVNNFIEWGKDQDWFKNTTIAVMGDHPAMIAPEVAGFPQVPTEHYWLDFFVNSQIDSIPNKKRLFTSFDMYPTILEAMGAKIEGRALGLGRSLFSDEQTLIEKYGKDSLNTLIKKKGAMYKHFWD